MSLLQYIESKHHITQGDCTDVEFSRQKSCQTLLLEVHKEDWKVCHYSHKSSLKLSITPFFPSRFRDFFPFISKNKLKEESTRHEACSALWFLSRNFVLRGDTERQKRFLGTIKSSRCIIKAPLLLAILWQYICRAAPLVATNSRMLLQDRRRELTRSNYVFNLIFRQAKMTDGPEFFF